MPATEIERGHHTIFVIFLQFQTGRHLWALSFQRPASAGLWQTNWPTQRTVLGRFEQRERRS